MVADAPQQIDGATREDSPARDPWQRVWHLPCAVAVELPIHACRVSDVLALSAGSLLDTRWRVGRDLPLLVNQQVVAWVEFEVMSGQLAVRITELADDPGEAPASTLVEDRENQSHA